MSLPRLGLLPPHPDKPRLMLRDFLTGQVPEHPPAADHFALVADWGLYDNDKYGDCGPTSVANSRKLITRYLTGTEVSPSLADVLDLYRRCGNNPPEVDNGVIMQDMLAEVVRGGIGGTRALGFAEVDHRNEAELDAATSIFGCLLLGVSLQKAQHDAKVWDYHPSPDWGGHAVPTGRYTPKRRTVVSWAHLYDMTDAFVAHQLMEAWVVIWPEHLVNPAFQAGMDLGRFKQAYRAITGRRFPA